MLIGVFDFEATDKDTNISRITQAAISIYDTDDEWREVHHYSSLCYAADYPELDPVAAAITGISRTQLARFGVDASGVIKNVLKVFSLCDYICGHNIRSFDLPLLAMECKRHNLNFELSNPTIDTRFDIPWPSHIDTRKLLYLAAEYGLANPMAHSARHDVDLTCYLLKQFPLDVVIERSKSPDITIQAMVNYDTKELAKARKFSWNGEKKIWTKQIKELDFEFEVSQAKFTIVKING